MMLLGLSIDIVGVLVIGFGFFRKSFLSGNAGQEILNSQGYLDAGAGVRKTLEKLDDRERAANKAGMVGTCFLILGFALQLLSTILNKCKES